MDPQTQAKVHENIGELRGRLSSVEARLESLEKSIDSRLGRIEESIERLQECVTSTKGGWKAITLLATIGAATLAAGAWLFDRFWR
jgi:chromosome segregation ATPase